MRRQQSLMILALVVFLLGLNACGGGTIEGTGDVPGDGTELEDADLDVEDDGDDDADDEWDDDADDADITSPDGISDVDVADTPDLPDTDGDSSEPSCEPGYADWLCPCESDDDCYSGYCVESAEGKACSTVCEETCDTPGWDCQLLPSTCPDCQWICIYVFTSLCQPCGADEDCWGGSAVSNGAACLSYGAQGRFCGGVCDEDQDCPYGYACDETEIDGGGTSKQCRLLEGVCECNDRGIAAGASTDCATENATGSCAGQRFCGEFGLSQCDAPIPKKEECNSLDDDCDGATDEGIPAGDCSMSNEWGDCTGTIACEGGTLNCVGTSAEKESCNGLDDDCDGVIDNEYLDTDGDGDANCVDEDDDNDGVLDDGDLSGAAGDSPCDPGQAEGCDDNCTTSVNLDQADMDQDGKGNACDKDADGDGYISTKADGDDCDDLNVKVHPGITEGQSHLLDCDTCNGHDDDCDGLTDEGCDDTNDDGTPDCMETDKDGDGVLDDGDGDGEAGTHPCTAGEVADCDDNCPFVANFDQLDFDGDLMGDPCDPDDDNDGVLDDGDDSTIVGDAPCTGGANSSCDDNCIQVFNPDQEDLDFDGVGDICDDDDDGDNIPDAGDNCPLLPNSDQTDCDDDGVGAACDDDDDADGIPDATDNCQCKTNPLQEDKDNNGIGDACDNDDDADGVPDLVDNCPDLYNPDQLDTDGDDLGNLCDDDDDGDGILDDGNDSGVEGDSSCVGGETSGCDDNCPLVPNAMQGNLDNDAIGDVCDPDRDGDGFDQVGAGGDDCNDLNPKINPGILETQAEEDACTWCNLVDDDCDGVTDEDCFDTDSDGTPDCLTSDDDGDTIPDGIDNCPKIPNTDQVDLDLDGLGNACDDDKDGDQFVNSGDCDDLRPSVHPGAFENCNGLDDDCDGTTDEDYPDNDGDVIADCVDPDDDNDGVLDDGDDSGSAGDAPCLGPDPTACDDNCPMTANPEQIDLDGDSAGDLCDPDDDDDGVLDEADNCPRVVNPLQQNNDADEAGDICDPDDDNDGVLDDGDDSGLGGDANCSGGASAACDDNCPMTANTDQADNDDDATGDLCDPDDDNDGVLDDGNNSGTEGDFPCFGGDSQNCDDNCPMTANSAQENLDDDELGDPCDADQDGDGFDALEAGGTDCDDRDAAVHPEVVETQILEEDCVFCNAIDDDCDGDTDEGCFDTDSNGTPDCLSSDDDGDGVPDGADNCPKIKNAGQEDLDGDNIGDACDDDEDGDGFAKSEDCDDRRATVYPGAFENCNDVDDDCNSQTDEGYPNNDSDSQADCVDMDDDNDGINDDGDGSGSNGDAPCQGGATSGCDDNCPFVENAAQVDLDGDGAGDLCDDDDDDDGVNDVADNCPRIVNSLQKNNDGDGQGDACDDDDDNDGVLDSGDGDDVIGNHPCTAGGTSGCDDNCVFLANTSQLDADGDGRGDVCDGDTDGDGDPNDTDCNDYDPEILHGAPEICDGIDNDCDGKTDAADATDLLAWDLQSCENQAGVCAGATKRAALCTNGSWAFCDDAQYLAYAPVFEADSEATCDGLDNDCDSKVDEDFRLTLLDQTTVVGIDQSCGVGLCAGGTTVCSADATGIRCDKEAMAVPESCNNLDDDCDGLTDVADAEDLALYDARLCENQQGVCSGSVKPISRCVNGAWLPCSDTTYSNYAVTYQFGVEASCDGLDNDCNGAVDEDFSITGADGTLYVGAGKNCGAGVCAGGATVCTPEQTGIRCTSFGNASVEVCDGNDNDCDGKTDGADATDLLANDAQLCEQQKGTCFGTSKPTQLCQGGAWLPCVDATYMAQRVDYEAAIESSCDGVDNDCNGATDEDFSMITLSGVTLAGAGQACGAGKCAGGFTQCNIPKDGIICSTESKAAYEICNNVDDDCDGAVDAADAADLEQHDQRQCENQTGACSGSSKPARLCSGGQWSVCDAAAYEANNASYDNGTETSCDGIDNDCSGQTDEDFSLTLLNGDLVLGVQKSCGTGVCAGGQTICKANKTGIACNTESKSTSEICNGVDDDCDGLTDSADGADLIAHETKACENQVGVCSGATKPASLCQLGSWVACTATTYNAHSGNLYEASSENSCDAHDNDCDGITDEGAYNLCSGTANKCVYGACLSDTVSIPAGNFYMGCNVTVDNQCQTDELPYHTENVPAFRVDRTEVTAEVYAECVGAGSCTAPTNAACSDSGLTTYGRAGYEQHPVTCVTFAQANTFCTWSGGRMCTEREWEKAARGGCELYGNCGTQSYKFPWGNSAALCTRAVMADGGAGCGTSWTFPVGSRDLGKSPYGVLDAAGNAWEWVSDYYRPDYSAPVITDVATRHGVRRGGGYKNCSELRNSSRDAKPKTEANADHGFRCCSN